MDSFTPLTGLLGGILIGLAAIGMMRFNQKICGISGIFASALPPAEKDSGWRFAFILGLLFGGLLLRIFYQEAFQYTLDHSFPFILFSGFMVGFGSRLGRGCTSGHGVCGLARCAKRSFLATALFFVTAVITASVMSFFKG